MRSTCSIFDRFYIIFFYYLDILYFVNIDNDNPIVIETFVVVSRHVIKFHNEFIKIFFYLSTNFIGQTSGL